MLSRAHHPSLLPAPAGRSLLAALAAGAAHLPRRLRRRRRPGAYAPNEILVKYAATTPRAPRARAATAHRAVAVGYPIDLAPHTRLLRLAHGVSVTSALAPPARAA